MGTTVYSLRQNLTPRQLDMLASAIGIAMEGFYETHVDNGGEHTDEDLDQMQAIATIARHFAEAQHTAHLHLVSDQGLAEQMGAIEYLTPVDQQRDPVSLEELFEEHERAKLTEGS